MSDTDRLDETALRSLDDLQLESLRLHLLRSGDERCECVVAHLLVRGIAAIERVARELCLLRGATAAQLRTAVIDASVRLQLRLTRSERLPSVDTLGALLAGECVAALGPASEQRPRLASRPPQLRAVATQRSGALRGGPIEREGGGGS
jgi:hypothetical protein